MCGVADCAVPDEGKLPISARSLIVSTLLAAALAAPACADAAAPWSQPSFLAGSTDAFPIPAFTPSGRGVVAWAAPGPDSPLRTWTFGALAGADDSFGAARVLTADLAVEDVAAIGTDGIIEGGTVSVRALRPTLPDRRPAVAVGSPNAPGRPRYLASPGRRGALLALAADPDRRAAVLFTRCRSRRCTTSDLYVIVRRAGHGFGRPITIARRENFGAGTVALGPEGRILVAWEEPRSGTTGTRRILARTRSPSGRLGREQRLGTAVPFVRLDSAYLIDGRAVVAWIGQRVSEGDAASAATISAAVAGIRRGFTAGRRLERLDVTGTGRYIGQAGVKLAPLTSGGLLAAWTGFQDGRFVVRASELIGTRFPVARVVSDPSQDTVLADIAAGSAGRAAVLGLQGIAGADAVGPVGVIAAVSGPGARLASLGGPEAVSGTGPLVEGARAAFDPVSNRVVAVWRDLTNRAIGTAVRPAP
jgi:hypothetical protein